MTRDDATQKQVRSANPDRSTWVSANAGSGKTRVLTDRVARMLYRGVPPQRILCLTYTKAAASEMQVRLFARLGGWAMAPDDRLCDELSRLGEPGPFAEDDLRRARRMFAKAIETPGGLKIQTIHAFCASVLRRFPLEAGVSPEFREIDDRSARRLRQEVLDNLAATRPDVFTEVAALLGADANGLVAAIVEHADRLRGQSRDAVWRAHGLGADADDGGLARICAFSDTDAAAIAAIAAAPFKGPTDRKTAARLSPLVGRPLGIADLGVLEKVFLRASEPYAAKIGTVPTKTSGQPLVAAHLPRIDDLMVRVEAARAYRVALAAARRSWTLHRFAGAFLDIYEDRKLAAGWLDFDDLIRKTRDLLKAPAVAEWILFRLDGGIDHILVDEAQDTSPVQWEVVESLAREFTAGLGARGDTRRTVFVVGDRKQSIYSFQGAAPQAFDDMRDLFAERLDQIGDALNRVDLSHSFRSSPAILGFVDAALQPHAGSGLGGELSHEAFHAERPGRVDLWPLIEATDRPDERPAWYDPVDRVAPGNPTRKLAQVIAHEVRDILARGTRIEGENGPRPVRPGDFLILVQRRSGILFREILRQLKAAGLAVAGADRLSLDAELAVKDIRSLLAFLATPDDDLALAEALRSPIIGLSEDALFRLAYGRGKGVSLWQAFRTKYEQGHPARDLIDDLRATTDFLRPFELIDRILTRHRARQNLLARLGAEAEEAIDALLALALDYERTEVPSLIGFLSWLDAEEVRIKRQMDNAGDQIRVMTSHGAKGLEAPIVILPDTADRRRNHTGDLILKDASGVLWKPPSDEMDERARKALAAKKDAEDEERMRLFYVSMTRAESWLIICGAGKSGEGAWHPMASEAMRVLEAGALETPAGEGWRHASGQWPGAVAAEPDVAVDGGHPVIDLPKSPPPVRRQQVRSPSALGGAKMLPAETGTDSQGAALRGTVLHRMLEVLPGHPRDLWRPLALQVAEDSPDFDRIFDEAQRVLSDPALAHIFGSEALAEVDLTAALPDLGGTRVRGAVDRLLVRPDHVLAVDFKSNAIVPDRPDDVPDGLLRQMGAYAAALGQIFPGKRIDTAILWTKAVRLMPLEHEIVRRALLQTPPS